MSAAKYQKILEHPECDKIIGKLVNGEPAKEIANYLKIKYHKEDEKHLRLTQALLSDFLDKYLSQYENLQQIIKAEENGSLDRKVSESLLNNSVWKDRLAKVTDEEIDFKKKLISVLTIIEQRSEQIFDAIQESPEKTKNDYVLIKYLELLFSATEKFDKFVNNKPDQIIQHNISVQMVQDHSFAFQEAIREALLDMDPAISSIVLDKINEKLSKMKDINDLTGTTNNYENRLKEIKEYMPILEASVETVEGDDD